MPHFLESYPDALHSSVCEKIIEIFESDEVEEFRFSGVVSSDSKVVPSVKRSTDIEVDLATGGFLHPTLWKETGKDYVTQETQECVMSIVRSINICMDKYVEKYDHIKNNRPFRLQRSFNIQRYLPGEGFYRWHYESQGLDSTRVLVFQIFLNDIMEGGGTEFNYDIPNLIPRQGTLALWPAEWTHYHRGIVAPNETKYIATGWFENISGEDWSQMNDSNQVS